MTVPTAAANTGWLFDQDTSTLGKMTVYYDVNKALRIDMDRTKSTLVMKAPDWRIQMFNKARKISFSTDSENFGGLIRAAHIAAVVTSPRTGMNVKFADNTTFVGVAAKRYLYSPTKAQSEVTMLKSAEYWVGTLPAPPRVTRAIEKLYNVPLVDGLPLALFVRSVHNYNYKELNTHYAKEKQLAADTFAVPAGYKSYSDLMEFWNCALGTDSGSAGLLEMIAPADEAKTTPKPNSSGVRQH